MFNVTRSRALQSIATLALLALLIVGLVTIPRLTGGTPAAATSACAGRAVTILGSNTGDVIVGTAGSDVIVAGRGNDQIDGRGGNDYICAGAGRDTVNGGGGRDTIYGGAGRDRINGGAGDDTIDGDSTGESTLANDNCITMQLTVPNGWRTELGRSALRQSAALTDAACEWGRFLTENGSFYHDPNLTTGEVLAYNFTSCEEVWRQWRNSPPHYNLITMSGMTQAGFICIPRENASFLGVGRLDW